MPSTPLFELKLCHKPVNALHYLFCASHAGNRKAGDQAGQKK